MTNSEANSELESMLSGFRTTHLQFEAETDATFVRQVIETTANLALLKAMVDRAPAGAKVDPDIADCMNGLREAFFLMVTELVMNRS